MQISALLTHQGRHGPAPPPWWCPGAADMPGHSHPPWLMHLLVRLVHPPQTSLLWELVSPPQRSQSPLACLPLALCSPLKLLHTCYGTLAQAGTTHVTQKVTRHPQRLHKKNSTWRRYLQTGVGEGCLPATGLGGTCGCPGSYLGGQREQSSSSQDLHHPQWPGWSMRCKSSPPAWAYSQWSAARCGAMSAGCGTSLWRKGKQLAREQTKGHISLLVSHIVAMISGFLIFTITRLTITLYTTHKTGTISNTINSQLHKNSANKG